ncbi:MAG: DUF1512 family protein [Nitrososphaerales archaeon]
MGALLSFILFQQRIQIWRSVAEIGKSLRKLEGFKVEGRKKAIDYMTGMSKAGLDVGPKLDKFIDYFTIMPVSLDPKGVVSKIEHLMNLSDERLKKEIEDFSGIKDPVKVSIANNVIQAANALNLIFKIVRHFYLLGRKTKNVYLMIQLQMIMPMIMEISEAFSKAVEALQQMQPIGDGIGPMIVGKMMLGKEKSVVAKETIMVQSEMLGRKLYLLKAEGPGGTVGEIGTAIHNLVEGSTKKEKASAVVMIDAALKLEGEGTGDVAEGIGAAIGGIGVDRYKIEEAASKFNIPLYAIIIKQSMAEALSVMKKEIADSVDKASSLVKRVVDEKTKKGDSVIIVGVGNSVGVSQ